MHLDGEQEGALAAATRAIGAHERLYRAEPGSSRIAAVYAERLRNRADIRRARGIELQLAGDEPGALAQYRLGVEDATGAIGLHEESGEAADGRFPLWVPSVRLLLAELHAWMGSPAAARTEAGAAIAAYRDRSSLDDELSALGLAQALSRAADVLVVVGDEQVALERRRESVRIYRSHLDRDGRLWRERHSQGTAWASTPTLEGFCRTAFYLATHQEPPHLAAAPEALLALQDAAEGFAGRVPALLIPWTGEVHDRVACVSDTVVAMERWLRALGEDGLADRYHQTLTELLGRAPSDWSEPIRALRPSLQATIDR